MRVGSIGYATTQGLGYLAKDFFDHGIVTDPIIYKHTSGRLTHGEWYPPGTPIVDYSGIMPEVDRIIESVDAFLFWETPFNWDVINVCRDNGVKTILVPMYEWTLTSWPAKPDALFCPSLLDRDYFKDQFPEGQCPFIPVPVKNTFWKLRSTATRFLHNAGNIGHREHKGTRELLEAVHHVKNPDFRLTIRAQNGRSLKSVLSGYRLDSRVTVQSGEIPYENLWDDHDVYVAPEKFNGLSLPLQESFAAGMMVMTTDRYPANSWLPREPLIPSENAVRASIARGYYEFDESIVSPQTIAQCLDEWVGKDISAYSEQGKEWADKHSWESLRPVYLEAVQSVMGNKPCQSF